MVFAHSFFDDFNLYFYISDIKNRVLSFGHFFYKCYSLHIIKFM
ncbi:protein of unknown function [Streptococcus thermophilus]|nr:protein of unknown function [Streptococcus thermophilus]